LSVTLWQYFYNFTFTHVLATFKWIWNWFAYQQAVNYCHHQSIIIEQNIISMTLLVVNQQEIWPVSDAALLLLASLQSVSANTLLITGTLEFGLITDDRHQTLDEQGTLFGLLLCCTCWRAYHCHYGDECCQTKLTVLLMTLHLAKKNQHHSSIICCYVSLPQPFLDVAHIWNILMGHPSQYQHPILLTPRTLIIYLSANLPMLQSDLRHILDSLPAAEDACNSYILSSEILVA